MTTTLLRTLRTHRFRTLGRAARHAVACVLTTLALVPVGTAEAAVELDPALAGQYAEGTGANATFLRIDGTWRNTSVYFKETPLGPVFSNTPDAGFTRVRDYDWGTGIWGLADWTAINAAGTTVPILGSWSGLVGQIDHADTEYPQWQITWGPIGPLPSTLFGSTEPQDNWTSHYTGYIRITDPGEYNFGVLYDDGFFLRIWGADGAMFEIASDFLSPRERLGFDEDFLLSSGLYRFELGAYDRLEVGAVNLAWWRNGQWLTVPTDHLVVEPVQIPTPGTAALLLAGIGAFAAVRKRRKRE